MNYRHSFHAGNFADVMKHIIVARIIDYLKRKDAAFRVIDTHAGAGVYALGKGNAAKTGEWREGIGRIRAAELGPEARALLQPYFDSVEAVNPKGGLGHYPGSPVISRHLLRKQDRLTAIELHDQDEKLLAAQFAGDFQTRIIHLDGWLSLGAHVPPKEKRGLVLIDPPFEEEGEFDRLTDGLMKAHKRWPGGIYALWYPLKDRKAVKRFHKALIDSGIAKILKADLMLRDWSIPPRMNGSGMIIVNPPFTLEAELKVLMPALATILGDSGHGRIELEWLTGQ
jgi:23S rRNA (adenine2030-N6)-methyltransferase